MDRLLEATARAERDHFWFRGFRRFIEPLVADAAARSVASRSWTAAAAPGTTCTCSGDTAVPTVST